MKLRPLLFLLIALSSLKGLAQTGFPYADEIRVFRHQDSLHFPPKNGILFIGSSSFRLWEDLEQRFAGKPVIKRGVGGCELSDIVRYYTPFILFPYHPRKIFVYAGENDIAYGHSGDSVLLNFKKLFHMIRQKLPHAKIYYLSIKPSPSRLRFREADLKANQQIRTYLRHKKDATYLDMNTAIYKPGTVQPDSSLFRSDYLHLNSRGYDRWEKVLKPYVN